MEIFDAFLTDTRDAMDEGQSAVAGVLKTALADPERFSAAIRARPKPWFFAADDTMTVFCTEGRPGTASAPHDHGTWSVLGCFEGSEESWWHEVDANGMLTHVGAGILRTGEAHSLPADAIHAVMNRWNEPNGVVHIYGGNFLAMERTIWDPVTYKSSPAGLTEPLAPAERTRWTDGRPEAADDRVAADDRPMLAGTAFASLMVSDLAGSVAWLASAFGMNALTNEDDSCAVDERFTYLVEPGSLTVIGVHASPHRRSSAVGLDHLALQVPTIAQLERWRDDLSARGLDPSPITKWNFGTFVEVVGPEGLKIRLFVPAVRS